MEDSKTINLSPYDILTQASSHLLPYAATPLEVPVRGMTNDALQMATKALEPHNTPYEFHKPRSAVSRQRVRAIALDMAKSDKSNIRGPLALRNASTAAELPDPKPSTKERRQKLKENFRPEDLEKAPFLHLQGHLVEDRLAAVSASVELMAVDHDGTMPTAKLTSTTCLWDTGSYACIISDDLLPVEFQEFLKTEIHDPYRGPHGIFVTVDAVFGFTGSDTQLTVLFNVMPVEKIPNQRSGIILGQKTFLECMAYRTIPRRILVLKGEEVDEKFWGDIILEENMDVEEETLIKV